MNSKKILIVSYTFYPDNNPRSLRWQALASQFIEKGYEIHVLTQQQAEKKGFKIFGRRPLVTQGPTKIEAGSQEVANLSSQIQVLKKKIRKVFKVFIWPDFSAAWLPWAIMKLFSLGKEHKYDKIISSSHPMSGHVPVLVLKKLGFLKSSSWIVDIGDPFGLISFHNLNNQFLYKGLNFRFEKAVCETADLISVTTRQTRDLYLEGYHLKPEKVVIAPPVLSLDLKTNKVEENPYTHGTNFIFAGTLYKEIRNPMKVLAFAKYLEEKYPGQYFFHFFGVLGDCAEYFKDVGSNVIAYGLVDRNFLSPYFNHADAIINIGNTSKYQLPSKIIEAIASKKFIFNFCAIKDDTSTDFLESYPGYSNIYDEKEFPDAIVTFEKSLKNREQIESAADLIVVKHSPKSISELFVKQ